MDRFTRQRDIVDVDNLDFPIHLIGVGAIGSSVLMSLAKMGCSNISAWDGDTIENHNISNQLLTSSEAIGQHKVDAAARLVKALADVEVECHPEFYDGGVELDGVVIVSVDSMDTRISIWNKMDMDINFRVKLWIDTRTGAEVARLYAIRPLDPDARAFYEDNLYPSEEAEELPCSARSIIYCPAVIGGYVASFIKRYACDESIPKELIVDIPNYRTMAS